MLGAVEFEHRTGILCVLPRPLGFIIVGGESVSVVVASRQATNAIRKIQDRIMPLGDETFSFWTDGSYHGETPFRVETKRGVAYGVALRIGHL